MDIYLLPRRDDTYFLYASGLGAEPRETTAAPSSRARKTLEHLRSAYAWVTRHRRRRELLLRSMGELDRVRLFHSSSMSENEARALYDDLVREEIESHGKWMLANAAAVPAAVPLSLIPGPNVLLGYLAWRSMIHYQSKKSGERATALALEPVPEPVLSELEQVVRGRAFRRRRRIRKLGEKLGLEHLDEVY